MNILFLTQANIRAAMLAAAAGDDDAASDRDEDLDDFDFDDDENAGDVAKAVGFNKNWSNPDAAGLANSAPVFTINATQQRPAATFGLGNSEPVFSLGSAK